MKSPGRSIALAFILTFAAPAAALAHSVYFKSPGPGMHFTAGQPIVVFADITDAADYHGLIVNGVGWPQMQVLVDGTLWKDSVTGSETVQGTNKKDMNGNPDPIGFNRFVLAGVPAGVHQVVVRGLMTPPPQSDGATLDSAPLTVTVDPPPAGKTMMVLTADVTGPVAWNDVFVVGNGHVVKASGAVTIKNSLVTGLGSMTTAGLTGTSSALDIQGSIFENTGSIVLDVTGTAVIKGNEFRANNLLTFVASDPDAGVAIQLGGKSATTKLFQGNRVGAGRVVFHASNNWLVGGDTDDLSNVVIGPRGTFYFQNGSTNIVFRGNYDHHVYRGAWSQGFNLAFTCRLCYPAGAATVLSEHNFLRGGSWIVQSLVGEFRYNVVYGYGHTWVRSAVTGASLHHNLFVPESSGGLDAGVQLYAAEKSIQIFNNTFDGGGTVAGDFAKAFVDMSGTVQVTSLRNNLFTFSRNASGGATGGPLVKASAGTLVAADYNSFFSPDVTTKDNYAAAELMEGMTAGFAAHDVSGAGVGIKDAQLATAPFAGARPYPVEVLVDEGAVWAGTQKVSAILAAFRARYAPAAGTPIIDAGDPADNDSMGRRADIGAIDVGGHDQDRLGRFGEGLPEPPPIKPATGSAGTNGAAGTVGSAGTNGAAGGAGAGGGGAGGGGAGGGGAGATGAAGAGTTGASGAGGPGVTSGKSGCGCVVSAASSTEAELSAIVFVVALTRRRRRR